MPESRGNRERNLRSLMPKNPRSLSDDEEASPRRERLDDVAAGDVARCVDIDF